MLEAGLFGAIVGVLAVMPPVIILWLTVGTALAALIVAAVVLPLIFPPKGRAYLPPPQPKD